MKRIKHTSKLPGNKKDLGNDMTASKLTFMHYIEVFRMVKVTVKYLPDVALSSLLHGVGGISGHIGHTPSGDPLISSHFHPINGTIKYPHSGANIQHPSLRGTQTPEVVN